MATNFHENALQEAALFFASASLSAQGAESPAEESLRTLEGAPRAGDGEIEIRKAGCKTEMRGKAVSSSVGDEEELTAAEREALAARSRAEALYAQLYGNAASSNCSASEESATSDDDDEEERGDAGPEGLRGGDLHVDVDSGTEDARCGRSRYVSTPVQARFGEEVEQAMDMMSVLSSGDSPSTGRLTGMRGRCISPTSPPTSRSPAGSPGPGSPSFLGSGPNVPPLLFADYCCKVQEGVETEDEGDGAVCCERPAIYPLSLPPSPTYHDTRAPDVRLTMRHVRHAAGAAPHVDGVEWSDEDQPTSLSSGYYERKSDARSPRNTRLSCSSSDGEEGTWT